MRLSSRGPTHAPNRHRVSFSGRRAQRCALHTHAHSALRCDCGTVRLLAVRRSHAHARDATRPLRRAPGRVHAQTSQAARAQGVNGHHSSRVARACVARHQVVQTAVDLLPVRKRVFCFVLFCFLFCFVLFCFCLVVEFVST